jgi:hypothetical protein
MKLLTWLRRLLGWGKNLETLVAEQQEPEADYTLQQAEEDARRLLLRLVREDISIKEALEHLKNLNPAGFDVESMGPEACGRGSRGF